MLSEYVIIPLVLLTILFLIYEVKKHKKTTVPGPPFVEGIRTLLKGLQQNTLHKIAAKWAARYGDIVAVDAVFRQVVFVNNAGLARKLLCDPNTKDLSNDRPPSFTGKEVFLSYTDIITAPYNKDLSQRRRLFHNVLKFYGQGVHNFEHLMKTTSRQLIDRLTQYEADVPLSMELTRYIRWVVGLLLKGPHTCEEDLEAMVTFVNKVNESYLFENEIFLETFPFVKHIPGLRLRQLVLELRAAHTDLKNKVFVSIRETFMKGEKNSIVTDLLDQQEELKQKGNYTDLSDDVIISLISDIAAAAYATTAGTLTTLFLQVISDPKLQERMYKEIREVIGNDAPSFEYKRQMPYIEATILETMRYSSVLPFLLPHYARSDINFEGHFIPKNTFLLINSWYFHHREDLWEDPWTFKPERFLDSNGQLLEPDHPTRQNLLVFGAGRRACPGESFARIRVFFVVVTLLQQYQFLPPEDEDLPSCCPRDWKQLTVISPDQFKCRMKPRPMTS
ncbi:cytochrome P450 1A1-like [Aplysia californica]|uniref:Cytochrome P450 1A1-like n=1 Tax=Aplysia californica TaxID=6500 RepID=A0ABM1A2C6_APLCA|nr:cytochrome P450 1A1-like [Aplysia californica]